MQYWRLDQLYRNKKNRQTPKKANFYGMAKREKTRTKFSSKAGKTAYKRKTNMTESEKCYIVNIANEMRLMMQKVYKKIK